MKIQLSDHFTYRKLIMFTIPSIITMIFTSIYSVIDGIFVSNFIGKDPFAALNMIYPFIGILGAIGFMIGAGGSAYVSKTLGEGRKEDASRYFSMLIYFMLGLAFVLSVVGFILMRPIAILLGANTDELIRDCVIYGRVLIAGLIPFMMQYSFQNFLVVAERPKMGLAISICAGLGNILGDYILIYYLRLGLIGAGLATVLSQTIGGLIPLAFFLNKKHNIHFVKTKIELNVIFKSCFNGISEMLTNISLCVITIFYNIQLMNLIGADGVVIYGIIQYLAFIFAAVFLGYSMGSAPIIGFHYGAQNRDELKNLFKKSILISFTSGIVMMCLAELTSTLLAKVFVNYDNDLMALTVTAIRLSSISFVLNGLNIFSSSFFTALNNGFVSGTISFLRTFVFQIITVLVMPIFFGLNGIWCAVVVSEAMSIIVVIIFTLLNKKKYGYLN